MATQNRKVQNVSSDWSGWLYFGGFMMMIAGIFEAIGGLVALFNDQFLVVTTNRIIGIDITTWGWIHLFLGIILITSALSLMQGRFWGKMIGVIMATFSIIANFGYVDVYPIWSLLIIAVDVMVLYAIFVHGNEI